MNWVHLFNYKPEVDAAYAVSDGDLVGVGTWKNGKFTQVHLDHEDAFDHPKVQKRAFVWWAKLNIQRFGVNKLDSNAVKLMRTAQALLDVIDNLENLNG